jgi:hypothetical protein
VLQVEAKWNPELKGQPLVVVQYNPVSNSRTAMKSDTTSKLSMHIVTSS